MKVVFKTNQKDYEHIGLIGILRKWGCSEEQGSRVQAIRGAGEQG